MRIKEEQETVITVNAGEEYALIWSSELTFQHWMERLGVTPYHQALGANENPEEQSCWYRVPKVWVKVTPPRHVDISPASLKNLVRKRRIDPTESRECNMVINDR